MRTVFHTIVGIAGVLAICWFLSPAQDWRQWAAVFLELAGIFTAVLGIIKTRYGITPGQFILMLFNRAFRPPISGDASVTLEGLQVNATGGTFNARAQRANLQRQVDELEKRVDEIKAGLEESIRRQGEAIREEMRQRDAEAEARQSGREERAKQELFEQHGLEVMGLAWIAVGILLSGPWRF